MNDTTIHGEELWGNGFCRGDSEGMNSVDYVNETLRRICEVSFN